MQSVHRLALGATLLLGATAPGAETFDVVVGGGTPAARRASCAARPSSTPPRKPDLQGDRIREGFSEAATAPSSQG